VKESLVVTATRNNEDGTFISLKGKAVFITLPSYNHHPFYCSKQFNPR
jgi:hypothetical protein